MWIVQPSIQALLATVLLITTTTGTPTEYEHYAQEYKYPQYSFSYGVKDPHTGDVKSQWEKRQGDSVQGRYSLVEPDGTVRVVSYTADDKSGFNAVVKHSGVHHHLEGDKKSSSHSQLYLQTTGRENHEYTPEHDTGSQDYEHFPSHSSSHYSPHSPSHSSTQSSEDDVGSQDYEHFPSHSSTQSSEDDIGSQDFEHSLHHSSSHSFPHVSSTHSFPHDSSHTSSHPSSHSSYGNDYKFHYTYPQDEDLHEESGGKSSEENYAYAEETDSSKVQTKLHPPYFYLNSKNVQEATTLFSHRNHQNSQKSSQNRQKSTSSSNKNHQFLVPGSNNQSSPHPPSFSYNSKNAQDATILSSQQNPQETGSSKVQTKLHPPYFYLNTKKAQEATTLSSHRNHQNSQKSSQNHQKSTLSSKQNHQSLVPGSNNQSSPHPPTFYINSKNAQDATTLSSQQNPQKSSQNHQISTLSFHKNHQKQSLIPGSKNQEPGRSSQRLPVDLNIVLKDSKSTQQQKFVPLEVTVLKPIEVDLDLTHFPGLNLQTPVDLLNLNPQGQFIPNHEELDLTLLKNSGQIEYLSSLNKFLVSDHNFPHKDLNPYVKEKKNFYGQENSYLEPLQENRFTPLNEEEFKPISEKDKPRITQLYRPPPVKSPKKPNTTPGLRNYSTSRGYLKYIYPPTPENHGKVNRPQYSNYYNSKGPILFPPNSDDRQTEVPRQYQRLASSGMVRYAKQIKIKYRN